LLEVYHETVWPEGKPVLLLLDEVQHSDHWDLHLKQLIDHRPECRIVATGSASVAHRQKLAESGVGRWVTVPVPTLSLHEFLRLRGEDVQAIPQDATPEDLFSMKPGELALLASRFRPIMPLFGRYMLLGGFPEFASQDDLGLCQHMLQEDVIDRVLKQDMPALFRLRNLADLGNLFVYLCTHSGGVFSPTSCASALGSTKVTVGNYLEALQENGGKGPQVAAQGVPRGRRSAERGAAEGRGSPQRRR
jgi:predicted AAA+ superfamily ATPase